MTIWVLRLTTCGDYDHSLLMLGELCLNGCCDWGACLFEVVSQCFTNVLTRCIVKGEAQKSPLFWRFTGVLDFLRSACLLGFPQKKNFKFNRKADVAFFTNTACKSTYLCNAPSLHTVYCFSVGRSPPPTPQHFKVFRI